jgi:hypothetical protein
MTADQHHPEADDALGPSDAAPAEESPSWRTMHRRQFLRAFTPGVIAVLGIGGADAEGDDNGTISIKPDE